MKEWLTTEFAWLGFMLTAMVGGVVGYLKHYEASGVELPTKTKIWGVARRVFMAGFAGWILYQFTVEYGISRAWGHIMAGIIGMFSAEFFEFMWTTVKSRVELLVGGKEGSK